MPERPFSRPNSPSVRIVRPFGRVTRMTATPDTSTTEAVIAASERNRRLLHRACWIGLMFSVLAILFVVGHPFYARWQLRQHGWLLDSMAHREGLPDWVPVWARPWFSPVRQVVIRRERLRINDLRGLRRFPELRYLQFEAVEISEDQLAAIATISKTVQVNFIGCRIEPAGLRHLAELPELVFVHFRDTDLTDSHLDHFAECRQMTSVDFSRTPILEGGLRHLCRMSRLERLELFECRIGDHDLEDVANCGNLKHLRLTDHRITDAGIGSLARLSQLESLILENCNVSDVGAKRIVDQCPGLRRLAVVHLPMTDAAMQDIACLPNLRQLELHDIPITDEGILKLKTCSTLKSLSFKKTAVTSAGTAELRKSLPELAVSIE